MAKRVDQVGLIGFAGQMGRGSKWVNWVTGQSGRGSSQVVGQVKLAHIFQTIFFFFFGNKCNLSIVSKFLNCD